MSGSEINSKAFQHAQLRSEFVRVQALLAVFGFLLALVVVRGIASLSEGHRGETWPFAVLLALMTANEVGWLRFLKRALATGREILAATWTAGIFIESLLPTIGIFLLLYTTFPGPQRALSSPAVAVYFLFILLSTLHLNIELSRWAGVFAALGYVCVSVYAFLKFPDATAGSQVLAYGTSFAYAVLLLLAGFAAGEVARQLRMHVLAALDEAENRARIAAFEHDLGIARSIQQGLLPKKPPQIEGFDIAGWNRPADETGGDYFDWQQLPDGNLAVTVADVTGHGIGPALGMSACRAYARAGLVIEPDPQAFLGRLNRLLYQDLPAEKFVTLAAGLLNPVSASLQLISAGHGPLLFYSAADDRFECRDAQGPPLGLLPHFGYGRPHVLQFNPGDILVLVTDGFIEWSNPDDEDFGQKRVTDVVRANRDKPCETIIAELYQSILKFTGSARQPDDLTAVVVKRL
jgi:serine phosphatase RsbU (regulator of sigma subunit)